MEFFCTSEAYIFNLIDNIVYVVYAIHTRMFHENSQPWRWLMKIKNIEHSAVLAAKHESFWWKINMKLF
jgi:hypothetical protein